MARYIWGGLPSSSNALWNLETYTDLRTLSTSGMFGLGGLHTIPEIRTRKVNKGPHVGGPSGENVWKTSRHGDEGEPYAVRAISAKSTP